MAVETVSAYLAEVFGTQPQIASLLEQNELPPYLRQRYALYVLSWEGRRFILAKAQDRADMKPATLAKDFARLTNQGIDGVGLVADPLPGYLRKRLIERQIPFVIPGRQLYWPALGAVVQGRQRAAPSKEIEALSPAAQVVVLFVLNVRAGPSLTPKPLAEALGYSRMSMSRALDDIVSVGVGEEGDRKGRSRQVDLPPDPHALWQKARPFLRSPVQKTLITWEEDIPAGDRYKAGESALAEQSMLGSPEVPVLAMGPGAWADRKAELANLPFAEAGACTLQVWRYESGLLAHRGLVDPFSLWLSLEANPDERVASALEELMEGQWE